MILRWKMIVYLINNPKYKVFFKDFSLGRLGEPSTGTSERKEVQALSFGQTKRVLIRAKGLQNQ